jgi:hypothetical protein
MEQEEQEEQRVGGAGGCGASVSMQDSIRPFLNSIVFHHPFKIHPFRSTPPLET